MLPGFVLPGLDLNRNLLGFVLMLLDLNLFSAGFGRIAVDLNLPLQIQARMIPVLTGFPQDFPRMILAQTCGFRPRPDSSRLWPEWFRSGSETKNLGLSVSGFGWNGSDPGLRRKT